MSRKQVNVSLTNEEFRMLEKLTELESNGNYSRVVKNAIRKAFVGLSKESKDVVFEFEKKRPRPTILDDAVTEVLKDITG